MSKTGRPSGGNGEMNRAFHEMLGPERSAVIIAGVVAAMKPDQRERYEARTTGETRRRRNVKALLVTAALLFASTASARDVVFTWTTPGDDGMVGRATRYEMRQKAAPVAGTDTLGWWVNAAIVAGMPTPGIAGTRDSVKITGLSVTSNLYFLMVTLDDVGNRSFFSNPVAALSIDVVCPAAVRDLNARTTKVP